MPKREKARAKEILELKDIIEQLKEADKQYDQPGNHFSINSDIITVWLLLVTRRLNESSRRLECLTIVLIVLTFILSISTLPAILPVAKDLWWGKVPF